MNAWILTWVCLAEVAVVGGVALLAGFLILVIALTVTAVVTN